MTLPTRIALALALCTSLTACGARATRTTLAVLPPSWQTVDALPTLDEREPLLEALEARPELDVRPADPTPECTSEDTECARRAGLAEGAEHVVLTSLASLGQTVVLRVTVLELDGGTTEQTHQEVLHSLDEARAREALATLGRRAGQPFLDTTTDDTLITVFSVGAAAAIAIVVALVVAFAVDSQPPGVDHIVVPP